MLELIARPIERRCLTVVAWPVLAAATGHNHDKGATGIREIACVGAGPGVYFSLLMKLSDQEHDVTVFERSKATTTYGWGVTYGDNLLRKLYANHPKSASEIQRASVRWREQVIYIQGKRLAEGGDEPIT